MAHLFGNTLGNENLNALFALQKRCIKLINFSLPLDSPGPVFLFFEVLALHDMLFLNNLKFIFSLFDNTMPLSLRYLYNTKSNIASKRTCRFHYVLILILPKQLLMDLDL